MAGSSRIGIVAIGRNEGERLRASIASLGPYASSAIYVDSGSTDGSQAAARKAGLDVVDLDMTQGFTAARARNAGFARLRELRPDVELVQFIDGDCVLDPHWIDLAARFLADNPKVAVVCGRRREKFPHASIFNTVCDREWNGPVGEIAECGGDILARVDALVDVGLYNPALIAGEEPEMCIRLRDAGWTIWRLDAEMTLHDANITRLGQWWRRTMRAGHAYSEVSGMHRDSPNRLWRRNVVRALGWSSVLPLSVLLALAIGPTGLLPLLIYPADIVRQARRLGGKTPQDWQMAALSVLGKFAETQGILKHRFSRLRQRGTTLIEYK